MAQREEAGKEELKVPEHLTLCALSPPSCSGHEKPRPDFGQACVPERLEEAVGPLPGGGASAAETTAAVAVAPPSFAASTGRVKRCAKCRRKVGLTGFRCRCGELFCGDHRYSDRHGCSYDYKAAGREAIKRDNPVVKAAKIIRI